jgi:hypothetical protein
VKSCAVPSGLFFLTSCRSDVLNVSVNFLPAFFQHRHPQLTKPVRFQYDHMTFPRHQLSAQAVTIFVNQRVARSHFRRRGRAAIVSM